MAKPTTVLLGINMTITNSEGLTFIEWTCAANCHRTEWLPRAVAMRAWLRGEDPTEYTYIDLVQGDGSGELPKEHSK